VSAIAAAIESVAAVQPLRIVGRVAALRGLVVLVSDLPLPVGSLVSVAPAAAGSQGDAPGEVVGFDGRHTIVMMLGTLHGIRPGDRVIGLQAAQTVGVGGALLGRCIDGLGRPIDGRGPIAGLVPRPIDPPPLPALRRRRISDPLYTGIRAIDLLATLGRGQRMGIFAGPGVGKSTLLACIARNASSDVNVVALIGERGREVRDFIEHTLGPDGLRRSVLVVATGDESPLMRIRACLVACAAAEHFRDQGADVLLLMDSVTRLAHAQRQVGLSVGEPPATRGYTPSVFALLSRVLERAGALAPREPVRPEPSARHDGGPTAPPRPATPPPCHPDTASSSPGSVTGLYTILVEGDDMTEPVADAVRGILDGHLILSRSLAQRAHYPAIDVLDSVSRVADDVCDAAHVAARRQVLRLLAAYRDVEDLIQIGAYARGANAEADVAIRYRAPLMDLLRQGPRESEAFEQVRSRLVRLAVEAGAALQQAQQQAQHAQAAAAAPSGSPAARRT
jgi:flagellum-specific ATP synthase